MFARIAGAFRLSSRELTILLVLFLVSLPAVTLRLYASDEVEYFAFLRSLYFDRDVSFENEYRHFYETGVVRTAGFKETFLDPPTETGLRRNFGTIGSAILWSPFYVIADAGVRIARAAGSAVAADGYSKPYIAAVCIGSAIYGFLAILLSIRLARDVVGSGLRAGLLVWVGTPLLFYMYVAPGFAHATSAFAVALFIAIWLHVRRAWQPRGVILLAASGALMGMVREQDAFFVIGPVADFAGALWSSVARTGAARERAQLVRGSLIFGAIALVTFVVAFAPQLAAYQTLNGRFGPSPLVGRKMIWFSPHALQVLLSPSHGFFFWTPLALLALAGLAWFAATARGDMRRLAISLLLMFGVAVYITGCVDSWTSAGAFGQRRFVNLTPLLAIGIAALLARTSPTAGPRTSVLRARTVLLLAAICVWWNLALIAQFGAHLMDRQGLELRRNAYTAFVTLPKLAPELAYRYVFDRASFYQRMPAE